MNDPRSSPLLSHHDPDLFQFKKHAFAEIDVFSCFMFQLRQTTDLGAMFHPRRMFVENTKSFSPTSKHVESTNFGANCGKF